jgi:hypothetical protein
MSNRKEILIKKYLEFKQHLDSIEFNTSLFPSLDDVDIVDLLFFFNLCFTHTTDYETAIRGIASSYGYQISDEKYSKGMPYITEYIEWLKAFQKT